MVVGMMMVTWIERDREIRKTNKYISPASNDEV